MCCAIMDTVVLCRKSCPPKWAKKLKIDESFYMFMFLFHRFSQFLGCPASMRVIIETMVSMAKRKFSSLVSWHWQLHQIQVNLILQHLGVSKNMGGPPKWMVYFMENPIKMHDLGVPIFFWKHPSIHSFWFFVVKKTLTKNNHHLQKRVSTSGLQLSSLAIFNWHLLPLEVATAASPVTLRLQLHQGLMPSTFDAVPGGRFGASVEEPFPGKSHGISWINPKHIRSSTFGESHANATKRHQDNIKHPHVGKYALNASQIHHNQFLLVKTLSVCPSHMWEPSSPGNGS